MLAAKKQAVAPSEEETICAGMTAAQSLIDRHVEQIKASQAGAGIPRESIRQMVMKGSTCWCRVANYLLEKEKKKE
jgi:hypothetical protein